MNARKQLGISGPEIISHPGDIEIDTRTGDVRFTGPMSRKEKAEWQYFDNRVAEADRNIVRLNAQLEKITLRVLSKAKSLMSEQCAT